MISRYLVLITSCNVVFIQRRVDEWTPSVNDINWQISLQFQGGRHGKGYACILSNLLAVVNVLSWGEVSLQGCVGEAGLGLGRGLHLVRTGILCRTEAGLKRAGTMLSRLGPCQLCASKLPLVPVLLLPPVLLLGAFGNTAPVWLRGELHALPSGLDSHLSHCSRVCWSLSAEVISLNTHFCLPVWTGRQIKTVLLPELLHSVCVSEE